MRELTVSDADALSEILGDPHVMRRTSSGALPHDAVVELVRQAEAEQADPARVRFCMAIVQVADGCLVGTVTLELDRYSAVYSHTIILRPGLANLAAGYETTQLVLGMAIEDLGAERFWCMAAEENAIANRLFLAAGGSLDGKIRHVYFRDGRWWDANMCSILKDEWHARANLTLREALAMLRRDGQVSPIPVPAGG
ncbi:GNAT family N-acetyltransferase [Yinghuangia aomiensis]